MILYRVLGLSPNASINQIQAAYKKITETVEIIPEYIKHAYQLLTNPELKSEYDNDHTKTEHYDLFNLTLQTQKAAENRENIPPNDNCVFKQPIKPLFPKMTPNFDVSKATKKILSFFEEIFITSEFPSKEKLTSILNIIKKTSSLRSIEKQLEGIICNYRPGHINFEEFGPNIAIQLISSTTLSKENHKACLHIGLHILRLKKTGSEEALMKAKVLKNIQNNIYSKPHMPLKSIVSTITNYQKDILQKGGFFCGAGASAEIELINRLTEPDYVNTYKSSYDNSEPLTIYFASEAKSQFKI